MSDNVTIRDGNNEDAIIATEDIGGVEYQKVKIGYGPLSAYSDVTPESALPISGTTFTGIVTSSSRTLLPYIPDFPSLSMEGQIIQKPFSISEQDYSYSSIIGIASSATILYPDQINVTGLQIQNITSAATTTKLMDDTIVVWQVYLEQNKMEVVSLQTPLKFSTNLTVVSDIDEGNMIINYQGYIKI